MHHSIARTKSVSAVLPVAIGACALLMVFAVFASPPITTPAVAPIRPCHLAVYMNDADSARLNLRSKPGTAGKIVASIGDSDAMFDATGTRGKWLRIDRVRAADGAVLFEGVAWVFAPLTAVRADRASTLHATPQEKSSVVKTMPAEQVGKVQSCDGAWVKVRHGKAEGWMAPGTHCGNAVTGCV